MGADIHWCVEKRLPNGDWVRAEPFVPVRYAPYPSCTKCQQYVLRQGNTYHALALDAGEYHVTDNVDCVDGNGHDARPVEREEWFDDRNYWLFGALTNGEVRNASSAGIFDDPRGVPADVSDEVQDAIDNWGQDGHSHSWLGLDELVGYDWWSNTTPQEHVVFKNWPEKTRNAGEPGFADAVLAEAKRWGAWPKIVAGVETEPTWWGRVTQNDDRETVTVDWEHPHAEWAGSNFMACLNRMAHVAATECGGDLSAVRAVFFFDN
jgi:hypothetical protein